MPTNHKLRLVAAAVLFSLAMASCSDNDATREDAVDVPAAQVDKSAPKVIAFSNHYPNVETKCLAPGQRVTVTTHDSATGNNVIVTPDERC